MHKKQNNDHISIGSEKNIDLTNDNAAIEQVDHFKYVDQTVTDDGRNDKEIPIVYHSNSKTLVR